MALFRSAMLSLLTLLMVVGLTFGTPAEAQDLRAFEAPVVLSEAPPAVPEGWSTVVGSWLQLYGPPELDAVMLPLSRHGSESVLELARELDVPVGGTIHVFVAPTRKDFFELQPGRPPEYADGTAWTDRGLIFLKRPALRGPGARPLEQVLDHELVHILLGRAFAPNHPPRWLQEGIAQFTAGEYDPNTAKRLARGTLMRGPMSLRSISAGFPNDPARADLAYAQSADFIAFLNTEYGEQSVQVLIREFASGSNIDRAVRRATGEWLEEVEARWQERFDDGIPLWLTLAGEFDTWWFVASVLAFFALLLARRRLRRRMVEYAEEEQRRDELLAALLGTYRPGSSGGPAQG